MESVSFHKKQLGSLLNRDKVKLWEPPYTKSDGTTGEFPNDIVAKYAAELNISGEETNGLLSSLRAHALQKLAEREKFQKSGKATLKIKLTGDHNRQLQRKVISLELELTSLGKDLKALVAEQLSVAPAHLKLISSGKVINDNYCLREQNIKNGSQIMALCMNLTELDVQAENQVLSELQETRKAAEFLSTTAEKDMDVGGLDIHITDQTGKPVQLPPSEKKALTLAMSLHEKGRQALKKKNVSLALPLLLEADKEFRLCSSAILDVVDNYAILCLDIVWCYLCLKNVDDLPDAADRLQSSETFFHKSYGSNLERLMTVKGSTGEELALFMRLHLLQGIVAFHQNKLEDAQRLLSKAETELKRLQVDEEMLTTVMSMGFTDIEARLGLRACDGNVQNAITHIMKRREEKKENKQKIKEEKRKKQLQKSLGKTANGDSVNVDSYDTLVNMGYPKGAAAESLRQSNNDINLALEVLQNHPEFLSLPDPEPKPKVNITDAMIAQVISMGFEPEMARRALVKFSGEISEAIQELIQSGGSLPPLEESLGTSSGGSTSDDSPAQETQSAEELKKEKERVKKYMSDLPENEEDYLDVQLEDETQFLNEYLSLINSLKQ